MPADPLTPEVEYLHGGPFDGVDVPVGSECQCFFAVGDPMAHIYQRKDGRMCFVLSRPLEMVQQVMQAHGDPMKLRIARVANV